jgi:hypothetical protein
MRNRTFAGRGALRHDVQSGEPQRGVARRVLDLIEVRLLAVGVGPTLDYADATAFFVVFETMIEKVRRRRLQ